MADRKLIELDPSGYVPSYQLLVVNSLNAPFRVLLSEFSKDGHNHDGDTLRFDRVDSNHADTLLIQTTQDAAKIRLKADTGAQLNLFGPSGTTPGGVVLDAKDEQIFKAWEDGRISFANAGVTVAPYGLRTKDDADWANVGYSWEVYASSILLKQNVVKIQNPAEKLEKIRGLTYTKNGRSETGFVVEEIEDMDLPGAVTRGDKENPLLITSYNPLSILATVVEALKSLTKRVAALEGRK